MRILLTNDGSAGALRAVPHAAHLATALDAELLILRVLDPRLDAAAVVATDLASAVDQVRERWEDELRALAASTGTTATPLVEVKRRGEETDHAVLRVADAQGVATIVMDSRGAGIVRHALLGSVAMGVVGHGCYPVVITGPSAVGQPVDGPYHVVITDDGSEAARDVVRALRPVLETQRVRTTLLRVYVPALADAGEQTELARVREELARTRMELPPGLDVSLVAEPIHQFEKVPEAIVRLAAEAGATAIAMSTHGHSALRHVVAGSVALGVLGLSPFPVILARCSR